MTQVLHILKKDIRCFRLHIVLVFASAIFSVRTSIPQGGISLPALFGAVFWIAGTLLISMVIHAEAIPGSRLHWLTRPYRWKSLLAAKLLFLFLFVALPPAILMAAWLQAGGFSVREFFLPLVLRMLTLFFVWIVPAAALAAVTEGTTAFFAGLLFAVAGSAGLSGLLCCSSIPISVLWVPSLFAALILIGGAAVVLFIQYQRRQTALGRAAVGGIVILAVVVTAVTPFALGMKIQTLASRSDIDHSSVAVSMENELFSGDHGRGFYLDLSGVPAGLEAHADALVGSVMPGEGKAVDFSSRTMVLTSAGPGRKLRLQANLTDDAIARLRGKPVTIRGSAFITLYTATRVWQHDVSEKQEAVVDGVLCGPRETRPGIRYRDYLFLEFKCRAMLDSPRGTLNIHRQGGESFSLTIGSGSYNPLPGLGVRPYGELAVHGGMINLAQQPRQPSILVEFRYTEPVSHFWVNFEIPVEHFLGEF